MATDVIMPALGVAQETGRILQWLKSEGDPVLKGEPLLEIETDKATVELEPPASGLLDRIIAPAADDDIPVGQVIAVIMTSEEMASRPAVAEPVPSAATSVPGPDVAVKTHEASQAQYVQTTQSAGVAQSAQLTRSEPRLSMASP